MERGRLVRANCPTRGRGVRAPSCVEVNDGPCALLGRAGAGQVSASLAAALGGASGPGRRRIGFLARPPPPASGLGQPDSLLWFRKITAGNSRAGARELQTHRREL